MTEQQVSFYGELFQKLQLTELCIEENDSKLLMKKEEKSVAVQNKLPQQDSLVQNQSSSLAQSITDKHYDEIKAPLLGIFHRAPAPDEPVFVEEGDSVKKGDVLCVIEAMKMMNEITAGKDGVIAAIHAEENSIVEYGQTLFEIM